MIVVTKNLAMKVLVLVIDFLLMKVLILFAMLFIKSIGDTLSNIKRILPILTQQYQYCDINSPTQHQLTVYR